MGTCVGPNYVVLGVEKNVFKKELITTVTDTFRQGL